MKNLIFVLMSMTLMINCNKHSLKTHTNYADTLTFKTELTDSLSRIPYYQCDDYYAFTIDTDTKTMDSLYRGILKCTKEPFINRHDTTVIDTIFTFSDNLNKIVIYKAADRELLALYDVRDTIFELNGRLKPGISKDIFCRKFSINRLTKDTIDIGNLEQTDVVRFYFKDKILKRIMTQPYLD